MRLCRRRKAQSSGYGQTCTSRCPSSCLNALENPYEEVVRHQRRPGDARRLIALIGERGTADKLTEEELIRVPITV